MRITTMSSIATEVLKACVEMSERYLTDRAFPDKAIDVMDEVGARSHARQQAKRDKRRRISSRPRM